MKSPDSKKDSFYKKVFAVARKIPRGKVTSYGAIAKCLGAGKSSRMVGWAMHHSGNVFPPVPAHRVVNRAGMLTGQHYFAYPGQMQELLEREGVAVVNNRVKDFDALFWDPVKKMKF
ncbi:MAG TPA: MGMT family protein [Chitinophagales bacterium]|nr:MGMT family protein [Chitinophagales bacterium]